MVKRLKYFEPWWNNSKYVLAFCYGTSLDWDNQKPTRQSFTIWFSLQLLRVWKISLSVVRSISFYSTQSALFQKTCLDWLGLYIALRTRQKNNPAEIILWTRVHLPRHQADNFSEISAVTCLGWRGGRGGWGGEGGEGCSGGWVQLPPSRHCPPRVRCWHRAVSACWRRSWRRCCRQQVWPQRDTGQYCPVRTTWYVCLCPLIHIS